MDHNCRITADASLALVDIRLEVAKAKLSRSSQSEKVITSQNLVENKNIIQ